MPYRCRGCRRHFSVTSHTVMHGSELGARTWLLAVFLTVANPKGRSSVQLAADLGVTQKTAWHPGHRIRVGFTAGEIPGFAGPVEADETHIGGKAGNMHADKRRKRFKGRGTAGKTPVVGMKYRSSGQVTAKPVTEINRNTLPEIIADTALPGADVFTDGHSGYDPLTAMGFNHDRVLRTAGEHERGGVSVNGIENHWSPLKRCTVGTWHYLSGAHLHRYIQEHTFRYNHRHEHVLTRMSRAATAMHGHRLTYQQLISTNS